MTELADQRQTENNNLKELVAQLQRETAKPSSGAVTEPIPALANSTFTFNMPSANSSSGHESPVNPSVDASSSSTPGSSSNVPTPEGATDFNALFARPSASKPPFASTPQFASGDESTTFTSYVDPILGGLGGSSLFTSTGMSPGPPLNSMASRQSATSPESLTDKHKSTGFTPFTNPSPPLSETFGRDEYSSYPSLEEILGGASSSAFEGGLIPFSDKSPAATFDAPTPASDLFAAYRDSASSFGDTLFGKVTSPPPALSNDGPLVDYNQESLSSATSTRSSSIFDSRRGDSSSLSPPSTYNDKASPASLSQDPPCEIREQFKTLRGADAFDIDSLCSDLSKKAHCKESMRVALDQAVQQDMDVYTLFNNTGG